MIPVGAVEIALALGVQPATVWQWKQRGLLPPDTGWMVSSHPVWDWRRIEKWAAKTGRKIVNPPTKDT